MNKSCQNLNVYHIKRTFDIYHDFEMSLKNGSNVCEQTIVYSWMNIIVIKYNGWPFVRKMSWIVTQFRIIICRRLGDH